MLATAKVIADSLHPNGKSRLITLRLRVPNVVLAQLLTHRMFSRNAASMRAIPTNRIISDVEADPFIPEFLENKPGMQGGAELTPVRGRIARFIWKCSLSGAILMSKMLAKLGVHKQAANRLLSPFSYTFVLCTGTDAAWANFLHLRLDKDADPAIRNVAIAAQKAIKQSQPMPLAVGEYHAPYVNEIPRTPLSKERKNLLKQSVARCARVSYQSLSNPGKESTLEEDLKLYDKLVGSEHLHASPAEHQARPAIYRKNNNKGGNFGPDWVQYRKELPNEVFTDLESVLKLKT